MTPFIIQTQNLSKTYQGVTALKPLAWQVQQGEFFGLMGQNGAGKTTLLHILLGLLTPSSGFVQVLGCDPIKQHDQLAPQINFSSAYLNLPSNLKITEVLKIYSLLYQVKNWKQKCDQLLTLFEMTHLSSRLVGALSSGEKTRLNLCKALLNSPKLLLLDEPTASLDPEVADMVCHLLKKIQAEQKMTVIYTSHNMKEVEMLCDRVMILHRGEKQVEGTPEQIRTQFNHLSLEEIFIQLVRNNL